jgi:hypothetical protein
MMEQSGSGNEIPAGWEARQRRRQQRWLKFLGRTPPSWQDETLAPPIAEHQRDELLRAYLRRELSKEQDRKIFVLSQTFRSWAQALCRLLNDETGTEPEADADRP